MRLLQSHPYSAEELQHAKQGLLGLPERRRGLQHVVPRVDRGRHEENERQLDVALLVAPELEQRKNQRGPEKERDDRQDRALLPYTRDHPDEQDQAD